MSRLPFGGVTGRLARRELARHKGRSALVVVLVAIPVMALNAMGIVLMDDFAPSTAASFAGASAAATQLLHADGTCRQSDTYFFPACDDSEHPGSRRVVKPDWSALEALPQHRVSERRADATLGIDGDEIPTVIVAVDFTDPSMTARFAMPTNGLPGPTEVVLSKAIAERFELGEGDKVTVRGKPYTVSGTVRTDESPGMGTGVIGVLVGPGHPLDGVLAGAADSSKRVYLFGDEPTQAQIDTLNAKGIGVALRSTFEQMNSGSSSRDAQILTIAASAVASLLTATISAAAFAIGVRQQRRGLALLAVSGAPAKTIQQTIVGQGVMLGALGGLLGVVTGYGAGAAWLWWSARTGVGLPGRVVPMPFAWLGSIGVAALATGLAAWLPARQVVRADALVAVRDADSVPGPARWSRVGLVLVVLALGVGGFGPRLWSGQQPLGDDRPPIEPVVTSGVVCVVLLCAGLVLSVPAILDWVGRHSSRGPLPVRMALRDVARNRSRATSGVAASMAIATLFSMGLVAEQSVGRTEVATYDSAFQPGVVSVDTVLSSGRPVPDKALSSLEGLVRDKIGPVTRRADGVAAVACSDKTKCGSLGAARKSCDLGHGCSTVIAPVMLYSPELYQLMTGNAPTPEIEAAIDRGQVLAPPYYIVDGRVAITDSTEAMDTRNLTATAVPLSASSSRTSGGLALIGKKALTALVPGATLERERVLWGTDVAPTQKQIDSFERGRKGSKLAGLSVHVETGPHSVALDRVPWIALMGGALMLAVAAVTSALALHDARDSLSKLAAVGAASRSLRVMNGFQTLVGVGIGCLLGALAGVVPMVAMVLAFHDRLVLGVPWGWLSLLVIGVPVVSCVLAMLLARPPAPRMVRID